MQNETSIGNRLAAMFSAAAISAFMLTAYFAPSAGTVSGLVA